jgi:hypothetical protein
MEHLFARHALQAGRQDPEVDRPRRLARAQGLGQEKEAVEAERQLPLNRPGAGGGGDAPQVRDPARRQTRLAQAVEQCGIVFGHPRPELERAPADLFLEPLSRMHGNHRQLPLAEPGCELRAEAGFVDEHQPGLRRPRAAARGGGQGLLPERRIKPVREVQPPSRHRLVWRGLSRLDPEALALERIGGKGQAQATLVRIEAAPVDFDAGHPELSECAQQRRGLGT